MVSDLVKNLEKFDKFIKKVHFWYLTSYSSLSLQGHLPCSLCCYAIPFPQLSWDPSCLFCHISTDSTLTEISTCHVQIFFSFLMGDKCYFPWVSFCQLCLYLLLNSMSSSPYLSESSALPKWAQNAIIFHLHTHISSWLGTWSWSSTSVHVAPLFWLTSHCLLLHWHLLSSKYLISSLWSFQGITMVIPCYNNHICIYFTLPIWKEKELKTQQNTRQTDNNHTRWHLIWKDKIRHRSECYKFILIF